MLLLARGQTVRRARERLLRGISWGTKEKRGLRGFPCLLCLHGAFSNSSRMGFAACKRGSTSEQGLESTTRIFVKTYVDELFKILVQIGQVILAALVIGDQLLLPLQELLSLLLQRLALGAFVVDPCDHQFVLVILGVVGKLRKKVLGRDERELLILVAVTSRSASEDQQPPIVGAWAALGGFLAHS